MRLFSSRKAAIHEKLLRRKSASKNTKKPAGSYPRVLYALPKHTCELDRVRHSIMRDVYPMRRKRANQLIVEKPTVVAEMRRDNRRCIHNDI